MSFGIWKTIYLALHLENTHTHTHTHTHTQTGLALQFNLRTLISTLIYSTNIDREPTSLTKEPKEEPASGEALDLGQLLSLHGK